jgi:hypothetical protein
MPDLARLFAESVIDAAKAHHPSWLPGPGPGFVVRFDGGFAPARFAQVCKLWHAEMTKLWLGPPSRSRDWATRLILEHVKDRMEGWALYANEEDFSQSDDEGTAEDGRTYRQPWAAKFADPALVVGATARYSELRVAACAGRRFYYHRADVSFTMSPGLHSQPLDHLLPSDAGTYYEAPRTARAFAALMEEGGRGARQFKFTLPGRIDELVCILKARDSPLGGALAITGTGAMSSAGEDLVISVKVGDIPKRLFFFEFEDEIRASSDYPDSNEDVAEAVRDFILEVGDVDDVKDTFLETTLLRQIAPPYFVGALHAAIRGAFRDLVDAAGPPPRGVPSLESCLPDPVFTYCGGAGGQQYLCGQRHFT